MLHCIFFAARVVIAGHSMAESPCSVSYVFLSLEISVTTQLVSLHKVRVITTGHWLVCLNAEGWKYGCVCVFFTLNRSSTRRHPAHPVSVLILHPRKISSVVTSHDTEIMHRNAFDNAMSCPSTGYDRHNIHTSATEIHWNREIRNKQKQVGTTQTAFVVVVLHLFVL